MLSKQINFYFSVDSWLEENPDTSITGVVVSKGDGYIEIQDNDGYTQIINISKLFAVVY